MRPTRPTLSPNRSQFGRYESVSLSCSSEDSGPWTVVRNTSTATRRRCGVDWGRFKDSVCEVEKLLPVDSGVYWCERDTHRSEPVNITVHKHRAPTPSTFPTAPPLAASPPAPTPSTFSTAPPAPPPTPPSRASSSELLVPLVSSGLVLVLLLLLLLLLWSKRCGHNRQTQGVKDDACPEEAGDITYSDILHHQKRRPIRRTEREESPVYSSVKTEDICYSSIAINQSRDPAKRTKERTQQQKDSSTYAQIKVRTK